MLVQLYRLVQPTFAAHVLTSTADLKSIESFLVAFANMAWGMPLLVLLVGGGIFFTLYSRFLPFFYFRHAINVLRGKYDDPDDPGEISHFQALSGAIAATVGMGNISGVAVAIISGGPGALFWMWVSAIVGCVTKFFTCSLAVMYRGKDDAGQLQGGPMYVITEGMGKQWRPLAVLFCIAGMFGVLPAFQANQLTQIVRDLILIPSGVEQSSLVVTNFVTGLVLLLTVGTVIFGGIQRIANAAGKLVPFMVVLYTLAVFYIILSYANEIPAAFALIIDDAFSAQAVLGGAVGQLIITGVRRAAFSNEAGIGTAPMMHGAAKTDEPIQEGLVAMMGPAIDTLLVCTLTALAIILTGSWNVGDTNGITVTATAFANAIPFLGTPILILSVLIFAFTTMFTMAYYGQKCFAFVFGTKYVKGYLVFYVGSILFGAMAKITAVISLIDGMYAVMALPTMVSALYLSPRVIAAARNYFQRKTGSFF